MDKLIRTFLEISRGGSLTAASARLNITQPTLTKRLHQLERLYGTMLFERGVGGATLTDAGRVLMDYAMHIEAEFRQSHEAIAAAASEHLPVLRIGAGPLFHLRYMARALLSVRREHPRTRIELATGLYRETMADLEAFQLDVVFGAHEARTLPEQLVFVKLTEVEQAVALRHGHPLAGEKALMPENLARLDWVFYGKAPSDSVLVDGFFRQSGFAPPEPRLITASFTTGLQAVAQSDAAMMVPLSLAPMLPVTGLTIRRTTPPIAIMAAGAFVRRSTRSLPVVRTLVAEVKRQTDEHIEFHDFEST